MGLGRRIDLSGSPILTLSGSPVLTLSGSPVLTLSGSPVLTLSGSPASNADRSFVLLDFYLSPFSLCIVGKEKEAICNVVIY